MKKVIIGLAIAVAIIIAAYFLCYGLAMGMITFITWLVGIIMGG